ncbi:MAG: hypothetical protein AAF928_07145 [Myxococcota bacterium]
MTSGAQRRGESFAGSVIPLLAVGALASVAGCAKTPPPAGATLMADDGWGPTVEGPVVAGSDDVVPPPARRPRATVPSERTRWAHADRLAKLATAVGRAPSEHGDGSLERSTLVTPEQRTTYLGLTRATRMPPGTLIVQPHADPTRPDDISFYFAMMKNDTGADAWAYVVLDRALRVAADDRLDMCARCHDEAPYQGLFGPPRGATFDPP